MKKALLICVLLFTPFQVLAEPTASLKYDLIFGSIAEGGYVTENDHYFYGLISDNHSSLFGEVIDINRFGFGWGMPISENKKHVVGTSVGRIFIDGRDDIWFFSWIDEDITSLSLTYDYFYKGIQNSGFRIGGELMWGDFREAGIAINAGWKF